MTKLKVFFPDIRRHENPTNIHRSLFPSKLPTAQDALCEFAICICNSYEAIFLLLNSIVFGSPNIAFKSPIIIWLRSNVAHTIRLFSPQSLLRASYSTRWAFSSQKTICAHSFPQFYYKLTGINIVFFLYPYLLNRSNHLRPRTFRPSPDGGC